MFESYSNCFLKKKKNNKYPFDLGYSCKLDPVE